VSGEAIIDVPVLAARDRHALVETHLGNGERSSAPPNSSGCSTRPSGPRRDCRSTAGDHRRGEPLRQLRASAWAHRSSPAYRRRLFDQVLARLDHDHGRDMTASICRWIAVSRSGCWKSEILDLLAGPEQVFPTSAVVPILPRDRAVLRPVEEETGEGLLAFYHDQLRFAVFPRYFEMQSTEEPPTDAFREANAELAAILPKGGGRRGRQVSQVEFGAKNEASVSWPHTELGAGMLWRLWRRR